MNVRMYEGTALIEAVAEELKKLPEVEAPEWSQFVKTGVDRVLPPSNDDWWYTRAASVLRKVAIIGPVGVNKLRRKYGGRYRRGYKPAKFSQGSGKIIRVALQQLEAAGLIKQTVVHGHKGRVVENKGIKLLAVAAKELRIEAPKAEEVKEAPVKKEVKEEVVAEPKVATKETPKVEAKAEEKVEVQA
jgi:small subunit ribosomal protein S19e